MADLRQLFLKTLNGRSMGLQLVGAGRCQVSWWRERICWVGSMRSSLRAGGVSTAPKSDVTTESSKMAKMKLGKSQNDWHRFIKTALICFGMETMDRRAEVESWVFSLVRWRCNRLTE